MLNFSHIFVLLLILFYFLFLVKLELNISVNQCSFCVIMHEIYCFLQLSCTVPVPEILGCKQLIRLCHALYYRSVEVIRYGCMLMVGSVA